MQAGFPPVVPDGNRGPTGDEHLADFGVTGLCRQVENGVSPLVPIVQVRPTPPGGQEGPDRVRVPVFDRREQIKGRHSQRLDTLLLINRCGFWEGLW